MSLGLVAIEHRGSQLLPEVDWTARAYGVPPVSIPLTDPDGPKIEELAQPPTRFALTSLGRGPDVDWEPVPYGSSGDVPIGQKHGELTAFVRLAASRIHMPSACVSAKSL